MDTYCDRPMTESESRFHEDTFAGAVERLERDIVRLEGWGMLAELDQVLAEVRHRRDLRLFGAY